MKKILFRFIILFVFTIIAIVGAEYALKYISVKNSGKKFIEFKTKNANLKDFPENGLPSGLYKDSPVEKKNLEFIWDCYYGFKYKPNQKVLNKSINSFGFHDSDWKIEKDTGVYRIALLGGSVADGLADSETIDVFLEEILNKHKKCEVLNFGTTGMMSAQERILFINEVIDFRPDMAVFLDGVNELNPLLYGLKPGNHFYWLRAQYDFSLGEPLTKTLKKFFIKQSLRFSEKYFIYKIFFKLIGYDTEFLGKNITDKQIEESIRIYDKNIDIIKKVAETEKIKTIFFIQPLIYNKKQLSLFEKFFIESKPKYYNDLYYKGYDLIMRKNKDLKKNLFSIFDGIQYKIFTDNCHVVPLGNKIIAENIAVEIMKKWAE